MRTVQSLRVSPNERNGVDGGSESRVSTRRAGATRARATRRPGASDPTSTASITARTPPRAGSYARSAIPLPGRSPDGRPTAYPSCSLIAPSRDPGDEVRRRMATRAHLRRSRSRLRYALGRATANMAARDLRNDPRVIELGDGRFAYDHHPRTGSGSVAGASNSVSRHAGDGMTDRLIYVPPTGTAHRFVRIRPGGRRCERAVDFRRRRPRPSR